MEEQAPYYSNKIGNTMEYIRHLKMSLQLIEACFHNLPYKKEGSLELSLTYHYEDTITYNSIDEIIAELERCIIYQVSNDIDINIPAYIGFNQKCILGASEIEFFYNGTLHITGNVGSVFYNWWQSTPSVHIELTEETKGEEMLALYINIQEAIKDQIEKHEQN